MYLTATGSKTGTEYKTVRHCRRRRTSSGHPSLTFAVIALSVLASMVAMPLMGRALSSSSSQLLKGKRVLVTGGGRGIGRAIALICHDEGANVVITARTQSELEETIRLAAGSYNTDNEDNEEDRRAARLAQSKAAAALLARRTGGRSSSVASRVGRDTSVGSRRTGSASKARASQSSVSKLVDAVAVGSSATSAVAAATASESAARMVYRVCDVTDESQVESAVQSIVAEEGDIDVVINNAGGAQSPKGPVGTLEGSQLEFLLKLNVLGPQLITSAVCKHAPSWKMDDNDESSSPKVILNISSKAGKVGLQNYSLYVASKFALEGLTSCWAKELASRNVRVHSLSPGMVNTQSFPKPAGKAGVREASSIRECLLFALTGKIPPTAKEGEEDNDECSATPLVDVDMKQYTGHYIHVDEYDQVIREKGIGEAHLAWKPVDEVPFRV